MKSTMGGIRYVMKRATPMPSAARSRRRASAYAAGTAVTSVIATTASDTIAVLRTHVPNHVWVNRRRKCLSVGGRWNHSGNSI
jgi:hypothetical protein